MSLQGPWHFRERRTRSSALRYFTQPSGSALKATRNLVFWISTRKLFQALFCGLWLSFSVQSSPWLFLPTSPPLLFTLGPWHSWVRLYLSPLSSENRGYLLLVLCPVLGFPVPKRYGQTEESPAKGHKGTGVSHKDPITKSYWNIFYMRKHREMGAQQEERKLRGIFFSVSFQGGRIK